MALKKENRPKAGFGKITISLCGCLLLAILLITACKKDPKETSKQPVSGKDSVTVIKKDSVTVIKKDSVKVTRDVYVAGFYIIDYVMCAKYWKNGVSVNLTDGKISSNAFSIFVSDKNDVYVAGYTYKGPHQVATLWKNGVAQFLSDGSKDEVAVSVCVVGNDVYVGTNQGLWLDTAGKYWKNGIVTELESSGGKASIKSFYQYGSEIYTSGMMNNSSAVWKDGKVATLPKGAQSLVGGQSFTTGSDEYSTGSQRSGSKYAIKVWKNFGIISVLTDGTSDAFAGSIFVLDSNIYVVGEENGISKLWTNNIPVVMDMGTKASSVFVK